MKRVLLVDEVDVLFSDDFFGKTYNPIFLLKKESFQNLIEYVMDENHAFDLVELKNGLFKIKESKQYLDAQKEFPKELGDLLDTHIIRMLSDKKDLDNPPYIVKSGMIAYKEFDDYSSTITYGYKTQAAYIKKFKEGLVDEMVMNENVGLIIVASQFSYAEIPKKFDLIMGVTGTLETLSKTQNDILESFDIKKKSYTPSLFGSSKLNFKTIPHFYIENDENNFFLKINEDAQKVINDERAVLIYFKDEKEIEKFKKSGHCNFNENFLQDLDSSIVDKQSVIRKASKKGFITLCTREFGRGIDFISYDKKVKDKGGLHVILTFFPDEEGEEIQIKGRTARQGQEGSFQILLMFNPLKNRFGIKWDDSVISAEKSETKSWLSAFNSGVDFYEILRQFRKSQFETSSMRLTEDIKKVLKIHNDSVSLSVLISNYEKNQRTKIMDLIKILNPSVKIQKDYHLFFVLDCSGSMGCTVQNKGGKETRWTAQCGAVDSFIKNRFDSSDIVTFVLYSSNAQTRPNWTKQPIKSFNNKSSKNYLDFIDGGTNFSAGLQIAKRELDKNDHKKYTPFLLFLSDGECSGSVNGEKEMQLIANSHKANGLIVYTMGFCDGGQAILQKLAQIGGGKFINSVNGIELEKNFLDISNLLTIEGQK